VPEKMEELKKKKLRRFLNEILNGLIVITIFEVNGE
jgi:hypothetical protein